MNVALFLVLRRALPATAVPTSPAFWLTRSRSEGATPTANNMMLQVQMFVAARRRGRRRAARWQYAAAPALLTGAVALFLAIL